MTEAEPKKQPRTSGRGAHGDARHAVRVGFLMDPLEGVSLKKDSTLAMIRAGQRLGWEIYYFNQGDLLLARGAPHALARPLKLTGKFSETLDPQDAQDAERSWHSLGDERRMALAEFDVIMMRKDPPFDMEYIYTTYFLERAEELGVRVVNRPQSLRDCNEKFFATQFSDVCPPLIVSRREDELRGFQKEHGNVVFKRLDGMGGKSVFRIMAQDVNLGVVLETLTDGWQEQIMGQLYLPEIADGDKRILLIDGEPVPYALARVPMAGESRGNLAAGGTGEGRELTDRDRHIAEIVGPELKRRGLTFVGIDVIGDYLTEVNVTCPTCIRELDAQFSLDIAGMLMDTIAAKL